MRPVLARGLEDFGDGLHTRACRKIRSFHLAVIARPVDPFRVPQDGRRYRVAVRAEGRKSALPVLGWSCAASRSRTESGPARIYVKTGTPRSPMSCRHPAHRRVRHCPPSSSRRHAIRNSAPCTKTPCHADRSALHSALLFASDWNCLTRGGIGQERDWFAWVRRNLRHPARPAASLPFSRVSVAVGSAPGRRHAPFERSQSRMISRCRRPE
jgi:hypothetical protein